MNLDYTHSVQDSIVEWQKHGGYSNQLKNRVGFDHEKPLEDKMCATPRPNLRMFNMHFI